MRTRCVVAASLLILLLTGCGPSAEQQVRRNRAFYLAPGAHRFWFSSRKGLTQVSYLAPEPYPAGRFLRNLKLRLTKAGWKPLNEDFLNPGIPSSNVRGWTDFRDATRKPEEEVRQWAADWERNGEIVTYFLHYRWPEGSEQQLGEMIVSACHRSHDQAQRTKKFIKEHPNP